VNEAISVAPAPLQDEGGPVFREPWEAQAFAMTLALHRKGLFTWQEWARTLATKITAAQTAGDADVGDTYYRHWLAALETLVADKRASSTEELARYQRAWDRVAHRTPHGQPLDLQPRDLDPQDLDPQDLDPQDLDSSDLEASPK